MEGREDTERESSTHEICTFALIDIDIDLNSRHMIPFNQYEIQDTMAESSTVLLLS